MIQLHVLYIEWGHMLVSAAALKTDVSHSYA